MPLVRLDIYSLSHPPTASVVTAASVAASGSLALQQVVISLLGPLQEASSDDGNGLEFRVVSNTRGGHLARPIIGSINKR